MRFDQHNQHPLQSNEVIKKREWKGRNPSKSKSVLEKPPNRGWIVPTGPGEAAGRYSRGTEENSKTDCFSSELSKMLWKHLRQTSVPCPSPSATPQELQNNVKSFREGLRQLKELLQDKVHQVGRASKKKEMCSEARFDTLALLPAEREPGRKSWSRADRPERPLRKTGWGGFRKWIHREKELRDMLQDKDPQPAGGSSSYWWNQTTSGWATANYT